MKPVAKGDELRNGEGARAARGVAHSSKRVSFYELEERDAAFMRAAARKILAGVAIASPWRPRENCYTTMAPKDAQVARLRGNKWSARFYFLTGDAYARRRNSRTRGSRVRPEVYGCLAAPHHVGPAPGHARAADNTNPGRLPSRRSPKASVVCMRPPRARARSMLIFSLLRNWWLAVDEGKTRPDEITNAADSLRE